MKSPLAARVSCTALLALTLAGTSQGASLLSLVVVTEGGPVNSGAMDFQQSATSGLIVATGNSTHEIQGDSGSLMGFAGSASARSNYSSLGVAAVGNLTNSYFDEDYDYEAGTGTVPVSYVVQANASFTQTLAYGGTATNYISTYLLSLTGNIQGEGAELYVRLQHALEAPQIWTFTGSGPFNFPINSSAFVHGNSPQEFSLFVAATWAVDTWNLEDGSDFSGSANFISTLVVEGIDLRDEEGNLMPQGSITSDSGEVFMIMPIPEPATALLSFAGLLSLVLLRRRG